MAKSNRRTKRIRNRADRLGISYTAAMRHGQGPIAVPVPGNDEPSFVERIRHDLPWADVFLDGRRAYEFHHAALPQQLPPPGDGTPRSGVFDLTTPAGTVHVSAHPVTNDLKASVIIRVAYPDGLMLAGTDMNVGDYDWPAAQVWHSYLVHQVDGFVAALRPQRFARTVAPFEPTPPAVSARHRQRRATIAAARLRSAVEDMNTWFGPDEPPPGNSGGNAAGDLFTWATLGFRTAAHAVQVLDEWGVGYEQVLAAQDAGLSLDNPEDLLWLQKAATEDWDEYLPGGWDDVTAASRDIQPLAMEIVSAMVRRLKANERGEPFRPTDDTVAQAAWVRDLGALARGHAFDHGQSTQPKRDDSVEDQES